MGKTSLIRRFVADRFDDRYSQTVGTLISKKTLDIRGTGGRSARIVAMVWDIMGRRGYMDLLKEAYFDRARGVFAVCDLTRRETLEALPDWLAGVRKAVGEVPVVVMGNKEDLVEEREVSADELQAFAESQDAPAFATSAKTGETVSLAFVGLLKAIFRGHGDPSAAAVAEG